MVGDWVDQVEAAAEGSEESICGTADNRVGSTDRAVGRIMTVGCTGWIVSNDAKLSAGHCVAANQVLQFNVPNSQPNGTIVNPPANDQFPITSTVGSFDDGPGFIGNDWWVFRTGTNGLGQTAIQRQGAFKRMTNDRTAAAIGNVRVTGYGVDGRNGDADQRHVGSSPESHNVCKRNFQS